MARKDWYYPNIPVEMAEALDKILQEDMRLRKYGIRNKAELIIKILGTFIANYEETNDIIKSTNNADVVLPINKILGKFNAQYERNEATTSNIEAGPTPTSRARTTQEKINRLLDVMEHHLEEKDCKHTLRDIMKDWFPEGERRQKKD